MRRQLHFVTFFAVLAVIGGTVRSACAQQAAPALIEASEKNWYVRATLADDELVAGRIRRPYTDSVSIADSRVAIASIVGLERRVREGGGWRSGAALGGVAMGTFVWFVYHGLCYADCPFREAAGSVLLGASVGVVIGSFIGEAASPARHAWVRIWP